MSSPRPTEIPTETLFTALTYEPSTGLFRWAAPRQSVAVGSIAGSKDRRGHTVIRFNRRVHFAHRLAWVFAHGEWPLHEIDHINGDRSDNRIANLRLATRSQNLANVGVWATNTSGYRGVSFNKKVGKWEAKISDGGRRTIGYFLSPEEAARAYDAAAALAHGPYAKLNFMASP